MTTSPEDLAERILTEHLTTLDLGKMIESDHGRNQADANPSSRRPRIFTLEGGHTDQVLCAIVLEDGRIATGSMDRSIRLWQVDGSCESISNQLLSGHKAGVCALAAIASQDELEVSGHQQLISSSLDSNVRLWNLSTNIEKKSVTLPQSVVWASGELVREPRRGLILVELQGNNNDGIMFYALNKAKQVEPKIRIGSKEDSFSAVCVLSNAGLDARTTTSESSGSDSKKNFEYRIATGTRLGFILLWRIRVYTSRRILRHRAIAEYVKLQSLQKSVVALKCLPDGRLASLYSRTDYCAQTIRIWNTETQESTLLNRWSSNEADVKHMCPLLLAGATQQLALLLSDKRVELWDASTGEMRGPAQTTNEELERDHAFLKILCVPSAAAAASPTSSSSQTGVNLYCVLLEKKSLKEGEKQRQFTANTGRLRLWSIPLTEASGDGEASNSNDVSSQLEFDFLKRVLLALQTRTHSTSVRVEVLNLSAVRLRDDDVPELLLHLNALPHLRQVKLLRTNCDPILLESPERALEAGGKAQYARTCAPVRWTAVGTPKSAAEEEQSVCCARRGWASSELAAGLPVDWG